MPDLDLCHECDHLWHGWESCEACDCVWVPMEPDVKGLRRGERLTGERQGMQVSNRSMKRVQGDLAERRRRGR